MKKLIIPIACILLAGCVSDNTPSSGQQARDYLEIWMAKWNKDNGKDIKPTDFGLYILEDIPGPATADLWNESTPYTYAATTIRSLSGTIKSTDDATLAKQLGTSQESYYYGPKVFTTGESLSYAGVDLLFKDMRMGGSRTAVIPAWLLTVSRYDSIDKYLDACSSTASYIYTVTLADQFQDETEWEKQLIADYVNARFPGTQSTTFPGLETDDGTFWFISDTSKFSEEDKREEAASGLRVKYTGYRLDGTIFDTTDEKTAIDNDVWSSSRTYASESISYSSTWSDITVNSSSYIDGFKAALSMMWWAGQKATVIFTSSHGYSASGSGSAIPGYCPLVFDLELVQGE